MRVSIANNQWSLKIAYGCAESVISRKFPRAELRMAPFMFCRVCRISHDKVKGHKYGAKHKQYLADFLSKARDVARSQGEGRFWCPFCELEVDENQNAFACESVIQHLGRSSHFTSVKSFFWEQGAGVDDIHHYSISKDELSKWLERCRSASASAELSRTNNIHSDTTHIDPESSLALGNSQTVSFHVAPVDDVQLLSVLTVGSSQRPLPAHDAARPSSNGWSGAPARHSAPANLGIESSTSKAYYPAILNGMHRGAVTTQAPGSHFSNAQSIMPVTASSHYTLIASGPALAKVVCPPLQPGEGNVHSGALPPWIGNSDDKSKLFVSPSIDTNASMQQVNKVGEVKVVLSKTQERKLAKLRPPNRVGAAWADMRRAQLERAARGETAPEADASWLPNFGRVWQSGSRHDTRKEFEAEKRKESIRLGRPLGKRGAAPSLASPLQSQPFASRPQSESQPRQLQPYVSKRQRAAKADEQQTST